MEWSTIPACLGLVCSFKRGNIEGTDCSKICVWCLCMYVLCLWSDWFCRLTWQRVDIYVRRVWKCVFAYDLSLTVLRWPCVVNRTLKSNYYYFYQPWWSFSGVTHSNELKSLCDWRVQFRLCCLMSSDVGWHIRDKLRPMPKHDSILLYIPENHKARWDGQPMTATSTLTQLLNWVQFRPARDFIAPRAGK